MRTSTRTPTTTTREEQGECGQREQHTPKCICSRRTRGRKAITVPRAGFWGGNGRDGLGEWLKLTTRGRANTITEKT